MADLSKLAEELGKLTVLEAAELVKSLEEEWGVSAAAPVAVAAAPAGGAAGGRDLLARVSDAIRRRSGRRLLAGAVRHVSQTQPGCRDGDVRTRACSAGLCRCDDLRTDGLRHCRQNE